MLGVVHYKKSSNTGVSLKPVYTLIALSLLTLIIGLTLNSLAIGEGTDTEYITVEVRSGDTVWGCVKSIYGESMDVRKVVEKTLSINGIGDEYLQPGDLIRIPVVRTFATAASEVGSQ